MYMTSLSTHGCSGNNAIAFDVIQANVTVEGAPNLTFVFTQDPSLDPTVSSNLNAARVNIFYLVNMVHDIAYRYGFTESAFNFQTDNFGLGGRGNDRVDISVQAPNGFDNAQFTTLPDGVNGMMTMYIWDETDPRRDGALENDIIVHEVRRLIARASISLTTLSEHSWYHQSHDRRRDCRMPTNTGSGRAGGRLV